MFRSYGPLLARKTNTCLLFEEEDSEVRDSSNMFQNRRQPVYLLCALFLVALCTQRPQGVSLYPVPLDDRSLPAVEEALREEGVSYWYSEGRLTVYEESLLEAKGVLLRRGLPEFCSRTSGTDWRTIPEQRHLDDEEAEELLQSDPCIKRGKVLLGCPDKVYYHPLHEPGHTCKTVFARLLVDPEMLLNEKEHLGILSLLAHSTPGVEMVSFAVVLLDSQGRATSYRYSLDLRNTDRLDLAKAEYEFQE